MTDLTLTRTARETDGHWCARIATALAPGFVAITPTTFTPQHDVRTGKTVTHVGGGAVYCPTCAAASGLDSYDTITVSDDDTFYCENCRS